MLVDDLPIGSEGFTHTSFQAVVSEIRIDYSVLEMPANSDKNRPSLSLKAQLVFAFLGLFFILGFIDGLWGFRLKNGLLLIFFLVGVCVIAVAVYQGKLSPLSIVGVVLSASGVGCLIVEGVIRLCLADPTIPLDEQGFQKRIVSTWPHPVEPHAKEGVFRILGLSDSFGIVDGADNYQYLLADMLTGRGIMAETVNFSVAGAHPADELELLHRFGSAFQPDLILNGFFVGNDFYYPISRIVEVVGLPLTLLPAPRGFRPKFLLLSQWLRGRAKLFKEGCLLRYEAWRGLPYAQVSEGEFLRIESKSLLVCQREAPEKMNWARTLESIHQIQEEAARMGAQYVMVIHPDRCQFDALLRQRVIERDHLDPEVFDLDLPQRYLKEDCERRGIPCLDLLPTFREQGEKEELYHFRDTHWNRAGNHLAARCIEEFLLSQGLVSVPARVP